MSKSGALQVEKLGRLCRVRNLARLAPSGVPGCRCRESPHRPVPQSPAVNRNSLNQNVFEFVPAPQSQPVERRARWCHRGAHKILAIRDLALSGLGIRGTLLG